MYAAEYNEEETEAQMIEANLEFVSKPLVSVDQMGKDVVAVQQMHVHAPIGQEAIQQAPFPGGKYQFELKRTYCIYLATLILF